jgi:hypothetical protein
MMVGQLVASDDLIEGPHVDEVEELREQLDRQRRVDPALPQQPHGRLQHLESIWYISYGRNVRTKTYRIKLEFLNKWYTMQHIFV